MSTPPAASVGRPVNRAERVTAALPVVFVLLAFFVSRYACWRAGVRFDSTSLPWFSQLIEPELLRTRLLESVYFHHAQPPLFNLFLGIGLKVFGGGWARGFAAIYLGFGAVLALCLYALMARMNVPRWPAALLTAVFVASPPAVLYENWLFYTYPEALLLCASAVAFHRFIDTRRLGAGLLAFGLLATLALARSTFHLAWLLVIVALAILGASRAARVLTLRAAAIPLVLVVAIYAKNAAYFGSFAASSWFGMNLAQIALRPLPAPQRRALVAAGAASPIAVQDPFLPLASYPANLRRPFGPDVPVLRRELKEGGWTNFNHTGYISLSRTFARDSVASIRAYPAHYLNMVGRALLLYMVPASDYAFVSGNRAHLQPLEGFYNRYVFGTYAAEVATMRGEWLAPREIPRRCAFAWNALALLGLAGGIALALRERRRTGTLGANGATALFLAFNILYVTAVSNLVEFGENNRLRFPIDPLVLALGAAVVSAWVRTIMQRRKRPGQSATTASSGA